jgi:hypothetical protein
MRLCLHTYSTIVFCNSTGKPKRVASSGEACSVAAETSEEGWAMVGLSRFGGGVALPAVSSDIVSADRVVRVCCGVAAQGEGLTRINMLDASGVRRGKEWSMCRHFQGANEAPFEADRQSTGGDPLRISVVLVLLCWCWSAAVLMLLWCCCRVMSKLVRRCLGPSTCALPFDFGLTHLDFTLEPYLPRCHPDLRTLLAHLSSCYSKRKSKRHQP